MFKYTVSRTYPPPSAQPHLHPRGKPKPLQRKYHAWSSGEAAKRAVERWASLGQLCTGSPRPAVFGVETRIGSVHVAWDTCQLCTFS